MTEKLDLLGGFRQDLLEKLVSNEDDLELCFARKFELILSF